MPIPQPWTFAEQVLDVEPPHAQAAIPAEPASGRGRRHGTSSSEPFDRWFRYPAGFASDYVSVLLENLQLEPASLIVDPFAGSAVTGTSARVRGLSFYGVEAHPVIAELSALKLADPIGPGASLIATAKNIAEEANTRRHLANRAISREPELIRRCFTSDTLSALISLRELIKHGNAGDWTPYMKWGLLATLRDVASVRVGWPYQSPRMQRKPRFSDPLLRFVQRVEWIATDLDGLEPRSNNTSLRVVQGDSREHSAWAQLPTLGKGCVSSPPYLNNFDYADATRLELYFWGEVGTWSEMCSVVRSEMLTATTQQSSVSAARSATDHLDQFGEAAGEVLDITERLRVERLSRARGKEYDRVVPDYFVAIGRVLSQMAGVLDRDSPLVWLIGDSAPYGVYIDTPKIIAQFGEAVGFTHEQDVLLRQRGQRWASNATRHSVELSERLIVLRRT